MQKEEHGRSYLKLTPKIDRVLNPPFYKIAILIDILSQSHLLLQGQMVLSERFTILSTS